MLTVPYSVKSVSSNPKHFQNFTSDSLRKYFNDYFDIEEKLFLHKKSKFVTLLKLILSNKYFILNHQGLKNWFYALFKKSFFFAEEQNCSRIFLKLRKK